MRPLDKHLSVPLSEYRQQDLPGAFDGQGVGFAATV